MWDGGYDLALGDEMNGFDATGAVHRWGQVEGWFIEAAIEHYPDSMFARMYRDGLSTWRAYAGRTEVILDRTRQSEPSKLILIDGGAS